MRRLVFAFYCAISKWMFQWNRINMGRNSYISRKGFVKIGMVVLILTNMRK